MVGARRAWELFDAGLQAFRAQLTREDWEAVEKERLEVVSALESYLDHMAAGTRIMAEAKKDGS